MLQVGDALADAELVLLAVPGQVVGQVVSEHGAALAGKIVIDAVNRMGAPEFDARALVAEAAPQARYVRAFNTLGWENFASPLPGTNLFFAADPEARPAAEELGGSAFISSPAAPGPRLPLSPDEDYRTGWPAAAAIRVAGRRGSDSGKPARLPHLRRIRPAGRSRCSTRRTGP